MECTEVTGEIRIADFNYTLTIHYFGTNKQAILLVHVAERCVRINHISGDVDIGCGTYIKVQNGFVGCLDSKI